MLKLLKDIWNPQGIDNELDLLRYRSNLSARTCASPTSVAATQSSKIEMVDPFTNRPTTVLAVKGSGGDLGSIKTSGFALLYMDKLNELKNVYKGEHLEDEMVAYYPLCASERAARRHRSTHLFTLSYRSNTSITCTRTGL